MFTTRILTPHLQLYGEVTYRANADGTFEVTSIIGGNEKTAAHVQDSAIIAGWVGETKLGFSTNWLVLSASCTSVAKLEALLQYSEVVKTWDKYLGQRHQILDVTACSE